MGTLTSTHREAQLLVRLDDRRGEVRADIGVAANSSRIRRRRRRSRRAPASAPSPPSASSIRASRPDSVPVPPVRLHGDGEPLAAPHARPGSSSASLPILAPATATAVSGSTSSTHTHRHRSCARQFRRPLEDRDPAVRAVDLDLVAVADGQRRDARPRSPSAPRTRARRWPRGQACRRRRTPRRRSCRRPGVQFGDVDSHTSISPGGAGAARRRSAARGRCRWPAPLGRGTPVSVSGWPRPG